MKLKNSIAILVGAIALGAASVALPKEPVDIRNSPALSKIADYAGNQDGELQPMEETYLQTKLSNGKDMYLIANPEEDRQLHFVQKDANGNDLYAYETITYFSFNEPMIGVFDSQEDALAAMKVKKKSGLARYDASGKLTGAWRDRGDRLSAYDLNAIRLIPASKPKDPMSDIRLW
jgi:hypothetical protein